MVPHKSLTWKLKHTGNTTEVDERLSTRQGNEDSNQRKLFNWCEVTSGALQGSMLAPIMFQVLVPIMFQVYKNYMADGLNSYINLLADDAKLMKVIKNQGDCEALHRDIDRIYDWSQRWKLEFNTKKCHVIEVGKNKRPSWEYKMGGQTILKSSEEKN